MIGRSLLVVACAACGGGHHHGVDAPPGDANTDTLPTSSGDPPANAVAIAVTTNGAPVGNVAVYFQKPDSTVELATTTDDRGIAWAVVADGDLVTAIEPPGAPAPRITTFTDVRAGDLLHLDLDPTTPNPQLTFTLGVPAQNGAIGYLVHDSCADSGDQLAIANPAGTDITVGDCGGGLIDFVIVPIDASGAAMPVALYKPDIAITAGGAVALTGSYSPVVTASLSYTSVPPSVLDVETYRAVVTPRGRLFDGTSLALPSGGSASTNDIEPNASGASALTVTTGRPRDLEISEQSVYELTSWAAAYSLDMGVQRLPEYATPAAFDANTGAITWTERAGGIAPNFVRTHITVHRDALPEGRAWSWRLAGARGAAPTVTFPKLPNEGFDFNPHAGDTIVVDEVTNAKLAGGYPAIRAHAFDELAHHLASGVTIVETTYTPEL